ncbi:hypothetical protein A9G11_01695 [Gilliamella sp. wkB108]|uniref:divergent polysaccharide deacetylase family protein n=1 Tax=Gilliamella sp. wkB108 TaxID=3120256 RepID=UPI00080EC249|nr:divergent polysaccharide deacetylase family protein [Gilliamella apicola]OCG26063.1 hypothetical protein A9G11_01695 [Gilliamella apicola]
MKFVVKTLIISLLLNISTVWAAKLAIVIDDFGYHPKIEEQFILLSPNITVAVLPSSSNTANIATFAHDHGNDVMIHMPMAPISKQPLEKDTLFPYMSEQKVKHIIAKAVKHVPYAIGINNHMGSLMTSNLNGMQHVMKALSHYSLFFLDSKTVAKSQVKKAASFYNIPLVTRDVFLDYERKESAIARQIDLAIAIARKKGYAIAIGHPYQQTLNVLTMKLANLPDDVELIKVSHLINPSSLPAEQQITLKDLIEKYSSWMEDILSCYPTEE